MQNIFSKFVATLILTLLLFVAFGGVSQHDRWKITHVETRGTQAVSSDAVLAFVNGELQGNYFFVYARENSLIFSRRGIERGLLEHFPRLKSVVVYAADAHTITVEVTERKPLLLWCGEGFNIEAPVFAECWFVDDGGFVFGRAPIFSDGVYREIYSVLERKDDGTPLRAVIPHDLFVFVRDVESRIERELGDTSHIFIKSEGEYGVVIRSSKLYPILAGVEIRFKGGQSAERLVQGLLAAISVQFPADTVSQKKLIYIDLRFGNKVFFGFEENS